MKHIISSFLTMLIVATPFAAQAQANLSSSAPEGTSLGANETIDYNGIALGNRVKLRGYVDFDFSYADLDDVGDDTRFTTSADIDFLFDFSPVTGEVHLRSIDSQGVDLEQAFARYSFNQDFSLSFGRQLTNLGYESDEQPSLKTVSKGYFLDAAKENNALMPLYHEAAELYNNSFTPALAAGDPGYQDADSVKSMLPQLRRNYVDGIKANFNNGMFGLSLGLHDGYWVNDDFNDNVAIDIAASVMIIPGLEARLGYAHQDCDNLSVDDIGQLNAWIEFNPGDLTLALEFDHFDFGGGSDSELWDLMFLANYQFVDWFGLTFRYSHEDFEDFAGLQNFDYDSDRFTLAFLFGVTDNFSINLEYTHSEIDIESLDIDADELYIEGLFTF